MNHETTQPIEYDLGQLSYEQFRKWIKSVMGLYDSLGMYEIQHALDSMDREHFLSIVRRREWNVVFDLIRKAIIEDVEKRAWKALAKLEQEAA